MSDPRDEIPGPILDTVQRQIGLLIDRLTELACKEPLSWTNGAKLAKLSAIIELEHDFDGLIDRIARPTAPDPLMIEPPDGMAYKWVVARVLGEVILGIDRIAEAKSHGWLEVPLDRHPDMEIDSCVLMERPKAEVDAAFAELFQTADEQLRRPGTELAHFQSVLESDPTTKGRFEAIAGGLHWQTATHVATPRGWVPLDEYRDAARDDGSNPFDDEEAA